MKIDIIEVPVRFYLHGIEGVVENERYAEVGLRLMDAMWRAVKSQSTPTTGINHWVYLTGGKMFVGVELRNPKQDSLPDQLAPLEVTLPRYLTHIHVGTYEELPQKWKDLGTALSIRGEKTSLPSLEIYGHHCDEHSKLETTILIGLQPKVASV